ncbi:MAG: metallopeptidase TldD-related protein, partial [Pseudonocardiaceae bacterium]
PVRRVDWLRDGTVNALAYSRAAAAELGGVFTPPPENLVLTGGSSASTDDLVARTERGLLLTCLWYIREVDPTSLLLTGLTRDGVYLIENGAVVGQVNNFRFNESPIDLLRRASEVGVTGGTLCREGKDWFTRTSMPPIRIPDFNMSSVSQAS